MNDRDRADSNRERENRHQSNEESAFRNEIPTRFVPEIIATDIEEGRSGRVAAAVEPIERENLEIAVDPREILSWCARFHRLLMLSL